MFKDQIVTKINTEDGFYLTDVPYEFLAANLKHGNEKWIEINAANASNHNESNKLLLNFDYVESVTQVTKEEINDIEQADKQKDRLLDKLGDLISEDD